MAVQICAARINESDDEAKRKHNRWLETALHTHQCVLVDLVHTTLDALETALDDAEHDLLQLIWWLGLSLENIQNQAWVRGGLDRNNKNNAVERQLGPVFLCRE